MSGLTTMTSLFSRKTDTENILNFFDHHPMSFQDATIP